MKPPFNPEAVTLEFADLMRRYRVSQVHGDRYGGQWVADSFRRAGIYYAPAHQVKSEIYLNLLPLVNARACSLLDDDRLVGQLTSLERRVSRGVNRDNIDHPPNAHDEFGKRRRRALVLAQTRPAIVTGHGERRLVKGIV